MEHYFSLHGITNELVNFVMVFSIWILNFFNGGDGVKNHTMICFLDINCCTYL
jgi:hypothetical protein